MSNPMERIICGAAVLLESMIEQAVQDHDDVNTSLKKIQEERISKCDHGITFDLESAQKLIESAPIDESIDPALSFIVGSPAVPQIRKRWPRLCGSCPKGCGYNGIYYASMDHYIMGDW